MNFKLYKYLENSDEIKILENSNESNLVIKSEYILELLIELLEDEFISSDEILLEINYYFYNNIIDSIRLNKNEYIIIIKL